MKYAVIDHASHNILGEFSTEEEAQALIDRLVEADPAAAGDLEIHVIEESP